MGYSDNKARDMAEDLEAFVAKYAEQYNFRKTGARYLGRCPHPKHEDSNPSCTVDLHHGRISFRCWSRSCKQSEIRKHLGLSSFSTESTSQLEESEDQKIRWPNKIKGEDVTRSHYSLHRVLDRAGVTKFTPHYYRGTDGFVKLVVYRAEFSPDDKTFCPYHWDQESKSLIKGEASKNYPLYRTPELKESNSNTLWIVEGEKTADALASIGFVVTTSGGSNSEGRCDWSLAKQFNHIIIAPDNDTAGIKYAKAVRKKLNGYAGTVEVIDPKHYELPEAGDLGDYIQGKTNPLPEIESMPRTPIDLLGIEPPMTLGQWEQQPRKEADIIFEGLFETSDKVAIIGKSKQRKTFFALQLAIHAAAGLPFLGFDASKARRVIVAQFEIKDEWFWKRYERMLACIYEDVDVDQRALIDQAKKNLHVFNLRGRGWNKETTVDNLIAYGNHLQADLIVIDPLYKVVGGDENKSDVMIELFSRFDELCHKTGAALAYVHHESKGRMGDRDKVDRGSGSGVIGRDYDCCLQLDAHGTEEEGLHLLSTVCRNYVSPDDMTIQFADGRFVNRPDVEAVVLTSQRKAAKAKTIDRQALYDDLARRVIECPPDNLNNANSANMKQYLQGLIDGEAPRIKVGGSVAKAVVSEFKEKAVEYDIKWDLGARNSIQYFVDRKWDDDPI